MQEASGRGAYRFGSRGPQRLALSSRQLHFGPIASLRGRHMMLQPIYLFFSVQECPINQRSHLYTNISSPNVVIQAISNHINTMDYNDTLQIVFGLIASMIGLLAIIVTWRIALGNPTMYPCAIKLTPADL